MALLEEQHFDWVILTNYLKHKIFIAQHLSIGAQFVQSGYRSAPIKPGTAVQKQAPSSPWQ
jgi:hypothetical protein